MKTLFIILSAVFFQILQAQDSLHVKLRPYKIVLYTGNDRLVDGYLNSINDSSVHISSSAVFSHGYAPNGSSEKEISYADISSVSLKRRGSVARGMLYGALSGALIGILVGVASGDDHPKPDSWYIMSYTAGDKAAIGGVALGLLGSLVGGAVGRLVHRTFEIKGKKEKFDEMRWALLH